MCDWISEGWQHGQGLQVKMNQCTGVNQAIFLTGEVSRWSLGDNKCERVFTAKAENNTEWKDQSFLVFGAMKNPSNVKYLNLGSTDSQAGHDLQMCSRESITPSPNMD